MKKITNTGNNKTLRGINVKMVMLQKEKHGSCNSSINYFRKLQPYTYFPFTILL